MTSTGTQDTLIRTEFDPDSGVRTLWLDRPERRNAVSRAMLDQLGRALDEAADSTARCLLVRGAGESFCAGADLDAYLADVDIGVPENADTHLARWNAVARQLRELRMPTVAAVHGAAYGGGLALALSCDLVVAGRAARLCFPQARLGATVDVGMSWLLPRLVGPARARRLVLTGEVVTGERAEAMGLVAYGVDDAIVGERAREIATDLATLDPDALRANRMLLSRADGSDLAAALDRERLANRERVASPAFAASIARYRR